MQSGVIVRLRWCRGSTSKGEYRSAESLSDQVRLQHRYSAPFKRAHTVTSTHSHIHTRPHSLSHMYNGAVHLVCAVFK